MVASNPLPGFFPHDLFLEEPVPVQRQVCTKGMVKSDSCQSCHAIKKHPLTEELLNWSSAEDPYSCYSQAELVDLSYRNDHNKYGKACLEAAYSHDTLVSVALLSLYESLLLCRCLSASKIHHVDPRITLSMCYLLCLPWICFSDWMLPASRILPPPYLSKVVETASSFTSCLNASFDVVIKSILKSRKQVVQRCGDEVKREFVWTSTWSAYCTAKVK